jgi:predicted DNA-binding transcriptional regulator AlpA
MTIRWQRPRRDARYRFVTLAVALTVASFDLSLRRQPFESPRQLGDNMPGANAEDDDLLTTAEVVAITRAPASTIRYWRHVGTGPRSFRLGRRVVYRRRDVLAWIAKCEVQEHRPAS